MTVRADAGVRLRRLLAVLAWLARRGRAPISELAERFGMTPEELVADLELAACCGLPPYTPDQLMEIIVDEDEVVAHLGAEFARPRRLSAAEGFALAAAARALAAVPGGDRGGALDRAVAKLEAALGEPGTLHVDLGEPPLLVEVRRAVEERAQVEIDYHSASRDEETHRVVDPHRLVSLEGRWYLDGYCHRALGSRRFRVDRILHLEPTGRTICHEPDEIPEEAPKADTPFVPDPEYAVVRVAVDESDGWLAEAVPTLDIDDSLAGRRVLTLSVASPLWLGRLLVQLGPRAQVLDPPDLQDAGRELAQRVLERYRSAEGLQPAS